MKNATTAVSLLRTHSNFVQVHPVNKFTIPSLPAPGGAGTLDATWKAVGLPAVDADPNYNGGAGGGVRVAWGHLDTGITQDHSGEFPFRDAPADGSQRAANRVVETLDLFNNNPMHPHGTWTAEIVGRSPRPDGTWKGAAYRANIYDARVLGTNGEGDTTSVGDGFDWLITKPIQAINCSLGGPHDAIMDAFVERCWEAGIVVCCAAGNSGTWPPDCDGSINSPAEANHALSCGACTAGVPGEPDPNQIYVQEWSSRGPRPDGSPLPYYTIGPGFDITPGFGDAPNSGTSFAAPHHTGTVLALYHKLLRNSPNNLPSQQAWLLVVQALENTAQPVGYEKDPSKHPNPYCIQGNGLVRVDLAYAAIGGSGPPPPPPPPPSNRLGLPSKSQIGQTLIHGTGAPPVPPPTGQKEATQLDIIPNKPDYGPADKATFEVSLIFVKDGAPLDGRNVTVTFAGASTTIQTDENGAGMASFICPSPASDTQEPYQAIFLGD